MVALNDISKSYSVRPLNEGETLNSFNCGDEELNEFILSKASEYKKNTSCSVLVNCVFLFTSCYSKLNPISLHYHH